MNTRENIKNKFKEMDIRKRLMSAFTLIIAVFGAVSVLVAAIMVYMVGDYNKVLDYYAFPQGDIGKALYSTAEVRSSTRGIIGYETRELIDVMKEQHQAAIEKFEYYREIIRPTMVTPEGKACMEKIDQAWDAYIELDQEIIELGSSTDMDNHELAQERMVKELAPLYKDLDNAMRELMDLNVEKGRIEQSKLQTLELIILVVIVITISVMISTAVKRATSIAKEIEEDFERLP